MSGGGGNFGASVGNALGAAAGEAVGSGPVRWPAPTWKLGTRGSDDRGGM